MRRQKIKFVKTDSDGGGRKSLAFFVHSVLQFPLNNREYYLTRELISRGWKIVWLLPYSYKNEGVPIEDYILRYNPLNIRGCTYLLPVYLAVMLRLRRIRILWLSGWAIRSNKRIYWLVNIMRIFGIKTVYDPIDPICLFDVAMKKLTDPKLITKNLTSTNKIYRKCELIFCVTPEMKSLLIKYGADESKLFVARWGTDINIFNRDNIKGDFRHRLKIDDKTILIGWLGSMAEYMGIKELLLPLIEKVKDIGIHFVIAGEGQLFHEIQAWVKSKTDIPITLMGRLSYNDAAEVTSAFDIYLVTTNPDSDFSKAICPIKCYDAMALGIPLVTTKTAATEHLMKLSEGVSLCNFSIDSFEQAIRDIISNKELPKRENRNMEKKIISHQNVSLMIADKLDDLAMNISSN